MSDYSTAPITGGSSPEIDWAWLNFGDVDPATEATVWGDDANPDFDQFSNLEEYGFVLSPGDANTIEDPVTLSDTASSPTAFQLRVRQRKTSSDPNLAYLVEISETLINGSWSSTGITEVPPRESIDAEAEWVTYSLPDHNNDPQFVRVNVGRTGL
ncbi:MAG: hypothetical protein AAFX93_16400 [Verrucomicrobiota bacterium]